MIALALSEDSISKRAHRDVIIESLAQLPESTRKVRDVTAISRHYTCLQSPGLESALARLQQQ